MINNRFTNFLLAPRYRTARHLFLQFVVFMITVNILWNVPMRPLSFPQRLLGWAIYFISIDAVFYINLYWLFPRFLLKNRLLIYALGVSGVSLIVIIAVAIFQIFTIDISVPSSDNGLLPIVVNAISGVLAMGFTVAGMSAILLLRHWILYNQRVDEIQSATLHSELKFLKNQINPHFLFNMLNNANVLIRKNPAEASKVLFKLEDLLRYQMNDNFREHVPLRSDIHFLNDYLNLEKVRRDHFDYNITEEGNIDGIQLPALLFIPFVENAVKHNFDSEHPSYVHLFFKVDDNQLEFQCDKHPTSARTLIYRSLFAGSVRNSKQICSKFKAELMNCIIIDDEPLAREAMEMLVEENKELCLLSMFNNAVSAARFMEKHSVDLIFLDIQMPGITGIEFAHTVSKRTLIIFTTAYTEYALDSYEVDAIDYLVKPIETERFQKAVQKALSYHSLLMKEEKEAIEANVSSKYFFVKSERKYFKVNYADILFIEGLKDYVILQLPEQRIITRMNMKGISELLPQDLFLRVNKSYIVNTRHIDSFDNNDIYIGNYEIAIGNSYRDTFFEEFLMKGKRKG